MRGKGKSTIVWLLMGMLVLGLGGFGVTNFSGGTSDVGSVGDVGISSQDYARGLRGEMQDFSARTGKQVTSAQAVAMGLDRIAMSRLLVAGALEDEANRVGVSVGDKAVGEQITSAPAFRGVNGRFDRARYADVLRNEGLRETEFEHQLRMDQARSIIQTAATAGVIAPAAMTDRALAWLLETRDIAWREFTPAQLATPIAAPDDAALQAWHQANADRFTAPETRKITYVWLTPEMLEKDVQVDDQALRDLYKTRIDEFQQPERRMVERLVFPTQDAAAAAKAQLDKGETSFEQLAAQRGLTLNDLDLGEVSQADLGAAGAAVFALDQPGIVGPANSDLGPALFSMNAILEPVNVTFEQARDDLRLEAAIDRARRQIEEQSSEYSDQIAGGASLEDLAKDTPMQLGQIDWTGADDAGPTSIAAYPEFREKADQITEKDFPELFTLDDGGVFAMRLDTVVPATLIPLDQVRDRVAEDWTRNETHRQLIAMAEKAKLAVETAAEPALAPTPSTANAVAQAAGAQTPDAPVAAPGGAAADAQTAPADADMVQTGLARGGYITGVPQGVVTQAFEIAKPGDAEVVDTENRVFLVTLDKINTADIETEEAGQLREGISNRMADSMRQDVFDYFVRALQTRSGIEVNQTAIDAVNATAQ